MIQKSFYFLIKYLFNLTYFKETVGTVVEFELFWSIFLNYFYFISREKVFELSSNLIK